MVNASDPDDLLSSAEAAAVLSVHPHTIRRWADNGALPFFRTPGRLRRFRRRDVEALLASFEPGSSS